MDTTEIRKLAEMIKELRAYNPIGALSRQDFAYYMEMVSAALASIPTPPMNIGDILVGGPAIGNDLNIPKTS